MGAAKSLNSVPAAGGPPPGRVVHETYRREPYVRVTLPNGRSMDGKAVAWTREFVLVHWMDDRMNVFNRWVPAAAVRRIPRDESAWQDPYDDFAFYYPSAAA